LSFELTSWLIPGSREFSSHQRLGFFGLRYECAAEAELYKFLIAEAIKLIADFKQQHKNDKDV